MSNEDLKVEVQPNPGPCLMKHSPHQHGPLRTLGLAKKENQKREFRVGMGNVKIQGTAKEKKKYMFAISYPGQCSRPDICQGITLDECPRGTE